MGEMEVRRSVKIRVHDDDESLRDDCVAGGKRGMQGGVGGLVGEGHAYLHLYFPRGGPARHVVRCGRGGCRRIVF